MRDLHTHTTFCDGNNTPEEMVCAAIQKGLTEIGLVAHSYTFFDESYCIKQAGAPTFRQEVNRLKTLYGDKIKIRLGIEQDYYSAESTEGYDYIIGAVHYVKVGNEYMPVDDPPFAENVQKHFGGDYYAFAEAYFTTLADVVNKTDCDIIAHFDLLTKFNEGDKLFDTTHPRYIAAWQKAADKLLAAGIPFEINTGAIARGYRTAPYPAEPIIHYLKERGAELILSGDAHSCEGLCHHFDAAEKLL